MSIRTQRWKVRWNEAISQIEEEFQNMEIACLPDRQASRLRPNYTMMLTMTQIIAYCLLFAPFNRFILVKK